MNICVLLFPMMEHRKSRIIQNNGMYSIQDMPIPSLSRIYRLADGQTMVMPDLNRSNYDIPPRQETFHEDVPVSF
jgi:hypothetical protein